MTRLVRSTVTSKNWDKRQQGPGATSGGEREKVRRQKCGVNSAHSTVPRSFAPHLSIFRPPRLFRHPRSDPQFRCGATMSNLLPVAFYGLEVPAGDVPIPAVPDFPATVSQKPQSTSG